jgi:hypothetical protein
MNVDVERDLDLEIVREIAAEAYRAGWLVPGIVGELAIGHIGLLVGGRQQWDDGVKVDLTVADNATGRGYGTGPVRDR